MRNLQFLDLLPILALTSVTNRISGSLTSGPVLTGPHAAYPGSKVVFHCRSPKSPPPVTYELRADGHILFASGTDLQGGQSASFTLKVAETSAGKYHCQATSGGRTEVSNVITLSVVTPPSHTTVSSEPSPAVAYEGSRVVLQCDATGSNLSYTWYFNQEEVTPSTGPLFHTTGNQLVLDELTPEHSGLYSCYAWSVLEDIRRVSVSRELRVTVKVYVSKPKISLSISKMKDSYQGNVTCSCTRGSDPVNFSLLVDDIEKEPVITTQALVAWFNITVVPGLDRGVAICRVRTELQELMSEPMSLEIVPVGGDVKVEVEYLYSADSTLVMVTVRCLIGRGTFPHTSWTFNDSVLSSETHIGAHLPSVPNYYAFANLGQTLVLTKLESDTSGFYRCRVRNSYDDTGAWLESEAVLIAVTEVFTCTIEKIALGFFCFLLLMMALGTALVYRMFHQGRAQAQVDTTHSDAFPLSRPPVLSPVPTSNKQDETQSTFCECSV
ncbi:Fc receptor-like protein 5 isoform X3 [Cynoglossus semilaevis]|uniref:Fc receptor-like protein 5 isoform X3 n=1 Tax=Cynoglossus semilaevis TaxID=244447 RepID=UPI0007DCAA23|nr:Fc receptor-like protein 5 isoform X3 [Cynoglossus semilaevis]